ncbi:hypothetical protein V4331_01965 [Lactococcus formosensis subsp. formosensis]|uniref:hypothetical protein n=1 Tax=Lactococcus formosensis TaxID=1281486 RepID=UPI003133023C
MNKEQKRKLALIAVLGAALLVGGTFAFQAFNQQAINDRLRDNEVEVGGRVHDYYNRETENKDVFVQNYGQEEIMARIRLSEFMEIQERGQSSFTPVVEGTERADVTSWTTWKPEAEEMSQRQIGSDSARFEPYSNLTFGWHRDGQFAPWYLPTFNLDEADERTAAAGHARDYIAGNGATDGSTDGATHPGDGTDAFWSEDESYDNSTGTWPGSQATRETAQHLQQERPPLTIEEWTELDNSEKIGDFWVIDYQTGWAYWASKLQVGETTSYLLDAAQMTPAADDINGSYYYGIHVSSHLLSPEHSDDFLEEDSEGEHHEHLADLLQGIRNNAMDQDWGWSPPTVNPPADVDSSPRDFNFGLMEPGRLFTMAGQQFRYLENQGGGNHLVIRHDTLRNLSWDEQEEALTSWYSELRDDVRNIVVPVASSFTTGVIADSGAVFGSSRWTVTNLTGEVASDVSQVVPEGIPRAFALSLADVNRLSGSGLGFANNAQRLGMGNSWWWLRTPAPDSFAWSIGMGGGVGQLHGNTGRAHSATNGGVRPALILHQPGT